MPLHLRSPSPSQFWPAFQPRAARPPCRRWWRSGRSNRRRLAFQRQLACGRFSRDNEQVLVWNLDSRSGFALIPSADKFTEFSIQFRRILWSIGQPLVDRDHRAERVPEEFMVFVSARRLLDVFVTGQL